jgi:hypothetical protein
MGGRRESALDRPDKINTFSDMDKITFETNAISAFHDFNYFFCDELQQGGTLKRMPTSHYATLLAVGALVGASAFYINLPSFSDNEVKAELVKLGELCDFIGVRLSNGGVQLVLFVHSDELAGEAIIGKCSLINERLNSFKKFTMRIGWAKKPVWANVFFVFCNSEKAFHYRQSIQDKCKHMPLFGKAFVLPWGVDLSAKSVWASQGLKPLQNYKATDLEAKFFR